MDNGDWGTFEAEDCNLLAPLKDFVFAPSHVEMSEVIETPYSYHIVKILRRYYGDDDEKGESPADATAGNVRGGFASCAFIFALALAAAVLVQLLFKKKAVIVRVLAHTAIWACAVAAAVLVAARSRGPEELRAPTRVHVAHIMLEKTQVPPELDAATAAEEVRKQKLGLATFKAQQAALERAQKDGTLTCAVKMTLLNKVKLKDRKNKEKKEARK